ncbi:MAG: hypothetical protein R6W02_06170, partial [Halomonas campaniensis]
MTMIFGVPLAVFMGQLLLGLINGAFYALLSLGLAVIFGLLKIVVEYVSDLIYGGEIVGGVRHPFPTDDFSSYILQAHAIDVIQEHQQAGELLSRL